MDRRFRCQDCQIKWFIPAHRADEPDLTECGACGGLLTQFAGPTAGEEETVEPDEPGDPV